jgi:hypothetical protein
LRDTMKETDRVGFENTRAAQQELGNKPIEIIRGPRSPAFL